MNGKLLYFLFILLFFSCRKDPQSPGSSGSTTVPLIISNNVVLNFTNVADNAVIRISKDTVYNNLTPKYVNANNDTFSISKFKYYISNIKLKHIDGSYYIEPESYHLIDASDSTGSTSSGLNSCRFSLKNVPLDYYVSIEFMLGVDSTRNCSGSQTGALDPYYDMFWTWSSGYIFEKFEGYSSHSYPNPYGHNLTFHIGGYLSPNNNIRTFSLPFNAPYLSVTNNNAPQVYLKANVLELFRTPNTIDFSVMNSCTSPPSVKKIVANYQDMFSVSAIKN